MEPTGVDFAWSPRVNRVLKSRCTTGKINFYKACTIIHAMWLEDMNPRNLSTVQRERKILEIMQIFCEENNFDDPVHLCNFAAKFANYDETASVFEPQLQLTVL